MISRAMTLARYLKAALVGPASHRLSVDRNTKTFNFFNGRRWSQVWLPRPLLAALSKLRTAHKRLSRVTDLRTDFLQKLSTQLIHKNQVIMVETLGTKNILKNRRLARAISDAGFGEFVGMLEYKCKWPGRTLVKVARFFPSSKLCCICHQKNVDLKLQDRWTCSSCHTEHQRDENAVVNIFVEGLRILAEGRSVLACGGTVGPKREFRRVPVKQETSSEVCGHVA